MTNTALVVGARGVIGGNLSPISTASTDWRVAGSRAGAATAQRPSPTCRRPARRRRAPARLPG